MKEKGDKFFKELEKDFNESQTSTFVFFALFKNKLRILTWLHLLKLAILSHKFFIQTNISKNFVLSLFYDWYGSIYLFSLSLAEFDSYANNFKNWIQVKISSLFPEIDRGYIDFNAFLEALPKILGEIGYSLSSIRKNFEKELSL